MVGEIQVQKGLQKVSGEATGSSGLFPGQKKTMDKDSFCHWPVFLVDRMGLGSCVSVKLPALR